MKKIKFLGLAFLFAGALLYSCKKQDAGTSGGTTSPSSGSLVTATVVEKAMYSSYYTIWDYPWGSNVSAVAKSTVISGPYIQILAINSNGSTMGLIFPAIVGKNNIAAANATVLATYSDKSNSGKGPVAQYLPDTGTITVASITATHVQGTFSWGGNKTLLNSNDSGIYISVSTGQFNLDYSK